jgi:large subunit ribosomal protein L32
MALPSKKRPRSEKRKRRAANRLKKMNLSPCPNCGKLIIPHRLCPFCKKYKGREIIKEKIKTKKV